MADDTVLEIGALINLSSFTPGMDAMVAQTKAGTTAMTTSFQQLGTTTASSTAQMTTAFISVPPAAQVIPPAIKQVAVEVEESTTSMWESFKELAAGIKEEGLKIIETTSEIGAKISETAERTRLGVGTMEAGFAGLAGAIGAAIAVGFAADFLDEIARVEIELGHLSVSTQMTVETLSGLRAVAQQNAIPFEQLQVALARMQRAQVEAIRGTQTYVRAFQDIGISVDDLKKMKPDDLFFAIANAISTANAPQIAMSSGMTLMGRGVQTLIPLLEKYGTNLKDITAAAAAQSGVTEESVRKAEQWHEETAKLSQLFQSMMIPVLSYLIDITPKVVQGFDAIGATLLAIATPITVVVDEIFKLIGALKDLFTLDWESFKNRVKSMWKLIDEGATETVSNIKAVRDDLHGIFDKPPEKTWFEKANEMMQDLGLNAPKFDLSKITPIGKSNIVQGFREELDQMRDAEKGFHELSKNEEAQFWASKLAIVKGNVAAFREVYHEFVAANRAAKHEELADEMKSMEERLAVYKSGSQQRVIILEEEINYLKKIGAEQTSEYKTVQEKLIVAQREAGTTEQTEWVKHLDDQVAAAGHNAEQRDEIINAATWFAINTYGIDSEAYKKALEEKKKALELSLQEMNTSLTRQVEQFKAQMESIKTGVTVEGGQVTVTEGSQEEIQKINNLYREGLITFRQYQAEKEAALRNEQAMLNGVFAAWEQTIKAEMDSLQAGVAAGKYTGEELIKVENELDKLKEKYKAVESEQAKMNADMIKQIQQVEGEVNKYSVSWQQFLTKFINQYGSMKDQFITGTQQMFTTFSNGFANAIAKSIVEGKNFGQAMAQVYNQMLTNFIAMLARMVEEMIIKYTVMKAITAIFGTGALDNSGLQAQQQAQKVISADTARSEADVFMQAIETVPFPANLAAAPAAAAAVGVMMGAISAQMGKAEKGALLPHDMLIQAHANELIIPSGISSGLQSVVAAGGFNPPPSIMNTFSYGGVTPGRSSTTNHVHNNTISPHINVNVNGDSGGMVDMHNQVVATLKRAVRNGVNFGGGI